MSHPALPDAATPFAAIPGDALPGDALAEGPEAVPQTAATRPRRPGTTVMLRIPDHAADIDAYFSQVYGGGEVRVFHSTDEFASILREYSTIDRLVVVSHSGEGVICLSSSECKTVVLLADDIARGGAYPSIGELHFDGCNVGSDPEGLYAFAATLHVGRVEAWTYFHHFAAWGQTLVDASGKPVSPSQVTLPPPSPLIPYAAPYLPVGPLGSTVSASALESEWNAKGSFTRVFEFFTYGGDTVTVEQVLPTLGWDPNVPPPLDPWTSARPVETGRYPRAAALIAPIDNASAGPQWKKVFESDLRPYRVIVTPTP